MLATLLLLAASVPQDPEPGISHTLAQQRAARISNVRYRLHFDLAPDQEFVTGRGTLIFDLADPPDHPVVVDFAGELVEDPRINGVPAGRRMQVVHDHLVLSVEGLVEGTNTVESVFRSRVAAAGTPLTRYHDNAEAADYLYTLLVPADAHGLFPCFDQPDLKARFELSLSVPQDWVVVANGAERDTAGDPLAPDVSAGEQDRRRYAFTETLPLPTYLFAFAAGPFEVVEDHGHGGVGADERPMRIFVRPGQRAALEADRVFAMHRDSAAWLAEYFDTPYPFPKLDIVLLPGFPYNGMEHAGAIFYRERSVVFEHEPNASELFRRSTLIYHEVSHQWFGNLVTMAWFDDLWLKEGFATFMAYKVLEDLEPERRAWLRFHQRVKPLAYAVDRTAGTTPIWQALGNLADAKSAYGPIVYNKAPAVLRELEARIGEEPFARGVQRFLKRHAFGNARWQDLVAAIEDAARLPGSRWSERWVLGKGVPRVWVEWSVADGRIAAMSVHQRGADEGETWPLNVEVMLLDAGGEQRRHTVTTEAAVTALADLVGSPAPECVLLNPRDVAYGVFLPDPVSAAYLLEHAPALEDDLVRAVAFSALWEGVRETDIDPAAFVPTALRRIELEADPETHDWLLDRTATALLRYITGDVRTELARRFEELLLATLDDGLPALKLHTFRMLARVGRSAAAIELLKRLVDDADAVADLELGHRDRYLAAAALLAQGDSEAVARLTASLGSGIDVGKDVYTAEAAAPSAETKKRYFESYLTLDGPPEQWMQDSLRFFHWPGQEDLTLPWLERALEEVEWVKQHRRIFFMPAWIDAFVNGHSSPEALAIVRGFLDERADLAPDIRAKLLQSLDGLDRAVRIRERFGR